MYEFVGHFLAEGGITAIIMYIDHV